MALAKCKSCGAPKAGSKYVTFRPPLNYPETALICSSRGCKNPALIWLTEEEEHYCEVGMKVFELDAQRIKVRMS
jgi:hypothetical protein